MLQRKNVFNGQKIKLLFKKMKNNLKNNISFKRALATGELIIISLLPLQTTYAIENYLTDDLVTSGIIATDDLNNDFAMINITDYKMNLFTPDSLVVDGIKKEIEKNDRVGLVIESTADCEADIYKDIDYIKNYIRDYEINFGVYLNIDNIMDNEKIDDDLKVNIINTFLNEATYNKLYVGINGTDSNVCKLSKLLDITAYDVFLIQDKKEIFYDGFYNIVKDLEGNVEAKYDISSSIVEYDLNNKNNLLQNLTYLYKATDNIEEISSKYNLSKEDLLKVNDLKEYELKEGVILTIPNRYNYTNNYYATLTEPIRGCDISVYQGENTNFTELSSNFDFTFLRCSVGTMEDEFFDYNAINCEENNIPYGVYCFNNYSGTNYGKTTDEFISEQEAQANKVLEIIQDKNIIAPVVLDIEAENLRDYLNEEDIKNMLEVWNDVISIKGYKCGIYCNESGFEYITSCVDKEYLNNFVIWIAGGSQYTGETEDIELEDVLMPSSNEYNLSTGTYQVDIIQVTDSAINAGASNSLGHIDVNYSYLDFTKQNTNEIKINDSKKYNCSSAYLYSSFKVLALFTTGFALFRPQKIYQIKKQK